MSTVAMMEQRKKIHPHKFTLWIGIASILMMFAGLTSAYIVKRNQPKWQTFDLPPVFWYSTIAIVASSITLVLAAQAYKQRKIGNFRRLVSATFLLGIVFVVLQVIGFKNLWQIGITLQANVSFSFLYVIVGLHALHVLGGIIALFLLFAKTFNPILKGYSMVPVEVTATYWHFVDVLWIYLLIFLLMIR
jgi:cytochrome c oxidase subunit III